VNRIMPKIAATIFFSLLLHVVFSKVGSDYEGAFVYWLLYTLACGMIINFDNIEDSKRVALMCFPPPIFLILATYYRLVFEKDLGNCWLSGTQCSADTFFFQMSAALVAASIFFIWLFSYLSDWVILLAIKTFDLKDQKAKTIRNRIVWIGSIIVAVIGVVQILAHGWRLG